jgi:hypothetical protein
MYGTRDTVLPQSHGFQSITPVQAATQMAIIGQRVELFGLSKVDLNGCIGKIIAHDANAGRCVVLLDKQTSSDDLVRIKPINIRTAPVMMIQANMFDLVCGMRARGLAPGICITYTDSGDPDGVITLECLIREADELVGQVGRIGLRALRTSLRGSSTTGPKFTLALNDTLIFMSVRQLTKLLLSTLLGRSWRTVERVLGN